MAPGPISGNDDSALGGGGGGNNSAPSPFNSLARTVLENERRLHGATVQTLCFNWAVAQSSTVRLEIDPLIMIFNIIFPETKFVWNGLQDTFTVTIIVLLCLPSSMLTLEI